MSDRVVVVGAGLAGLATGCVLASKGVEVTVLEKASTAGGKLIGWRDSDGDTVEHGMHGWWHQYFNFFDLMKLVGIPETDLLPAGAPAFVNDDGTYMQQRMPDHELPSPLFLISTLKEMDKLTFADRATAAAAMAEAFGFEHERDMDRYDGISLYAYLQDHGATQQVHDLIFAPLAHSLAFCSTKDVSAGTFLSALSFYLVGHQADITMRYPRGNVQELFIDKMVAYVEAHGGEVRTDASVTGFRVTGGRLEAALLEGAPTAELHVPLADIPLTEPLVRDLPDGGRVLIRRKGAGYLVLDAHCTHLGCLVDYDAADGDYHCPCHGGEFDLDGNVTQAPPTTALAIVPSHVYGADLDIEVGGSGVGSEVTGEHFVLCADIVGLREMLAATPELLVHDELKDLLGLRGTPSMVARLWLDKSMTVGPTSGVFSDPKLLDNFFVLSRLQEEFATYPGTVIEVHMYRVRDDSLLPDAQLEAEILTELGDRFPSLAGATVQKWHLQRHPANFTLYNPGSYRLRPGTHSPVPNLFFAGDWVRTDEPWWWMEKAIATGKKAANAVLVARGLTPMPVQEPAKDEAFVKVMKALVGVAHTLQEGIWKLSKSDPLD